jgi:hypothetical protein
MLQRFYYLGLVVAVISLSGRGEWVSLKNGPSQAVAPRVTVLHDDQNSTVLKIEVSGFEVSEFSAEGKSYQSIELLTDIVTTQAGSPEVPYIAKMLAIPDRGGVTAEVVEMGEVQKFFGYTLPPARPSWQEGAPEPKYIENEAAYRSMAVYPGTFSVVDEPVVFRDFRVARVSIHPLRYVAETKEVQAVSSITVRVRYGGGNGNNPKTAMKRAIAPSFGSVYRSSLINYESVLSREFGGLETGREVLLCIVPDTFATTFKPYAEWKNKTGTYVKVTKFSEIGANSSNPDIIKNYVGQCYHSWQYPPTYVLLVGDNGQVPKKAADGQSFANEDYFVEIDGNDIFPEMYIGRFTHDLNSTYGLQTIINKLIKYERNPYRANQSWFKRSVVCANNAYYTQPDTKRWVSAVMRDNGGFTVDTLLNNWNGPCVHNLTEVINAVNNGRSFLNYRGEGSSSGWWASCYPFGTSDVSSVNNGEMFTFVTSIGCGVAMFDASGGNCFGEQWMELGSPTASRGSCAFVGPTWGNTHTKYNNAIDKGLYVAMFQEGMETPAQTLLRGKIRMYNLYGGADSYVLWHFRTYTVLGDPSIHIWKDVPRKVDVTYTPQVSLGYDQIQVTVRDSATHVPVDSAQVCIAGDSVYVVGMTDATGLAIIPVTSATIDTLTLVVRGGRVVPAEGTVLVISDQEHVAPLGDPVVTDIDGNLDGKVNPNEHIQISYVLKNWGTQSSNNVQATLSAPDTTYVGIVNAGPVSYGTLPPNGSGAGSGAPLQFYVKTNTPVGTSLPLTLNITSSTRSWSYTTYLEVFGCNLKLVSITINDQGSSQSNGRLDPGETAIMYLTISNNGQDVAPNVAGILRCNTPYLSIPDSVGSFGTVAIGANATNTTNFFRIAAADSCPVGSTYIFTVLLSTQNGNYAYSVLRDSLLTVGLPSATDPTGPDPYGYYAYSTDDSAYEQAPTFNWVEIRSVGTRVPWATTGDFTATATLPFTFKHYGRGYSTVRVSSDGWLALGSGTQTSYTNYGLPHNDNIRNMVGLFWDDLFEGSQNLTSKLLYYSDVANHRFIVEWDSVGHYGGTTLRETFEAILLDPAYYPTPTGDGEIIFQYRIVGEETACTVGMEDSTQTIGMQYLYNSTYDPTAAEIRDGVALKFTTQPPTIGSTNTTVSVPIGTGWNLISNPVLRPDSLNTVRRLYPNSVYNYAFKFEPGPGYTQTTVMPNGPGFWAKFSTDELNSITGASILGDSVSVSQGWNIIGSISSSVDTSTITSIPSGLRASSYFGYSGGYVPVTHLDPGLGYWVKSSGAGEFVLRQSIMSVPKTLSSGNGTLDGLSSITINDSKGGSQTLYFGSDTKCTIPASMFVMPPLPPTGAFDARFESADGGTIVKTHPEESKEVFEFSIGIHSMAYPLTVKWNIVGGGLYELSDALEGQHVQARSLAGTGSLKIGSGVVQRLVLRVVGSEGLPAEYALSQNYPNPFNPTTVIKYALPVESSVSLRIYNVLGQEVCMLVDEVQRAGYRSVKWDSKTGSGLQASSGVYFTRLDAKGANGGAFSQVRKMLLMK